MSTPKFVFRDRWQQSLGGLWRQLVGKPSPTLEEMLGLLERRDRDLEAELEALRLSCKIKRFAATGVAGASSGTTPYTAATLAIPAQEVPGTLLVDANVLCYLSVATDSFDVQVLAGAAPLGAWRTDAGSSGPQQHCHPMGEWALAAETSVTLTTSFTRGSGSGTGQSFADYRFNQLRALWVPT